MAGTRVKVPVNGREIEAYLSPAANPPGPGLIVFPEWWGLVPHIESICDRLAKEGFTALAPDLYHGVSTKSPDEAGKLMMALNIAEAEADSSAAIRFLLQQKTVRGQTVGTVGFCMGGQLSLYAACQNPTVGACVNFYGIHPSVHPDLAALAGPVLGFFGSEDGSVNPTVVNDLEGKLRALGKDVEFHTYRGAGHAFFNDTRPVYDPKAAQDAWERMLGFFRRHLTE